MSFLFKLSDDVSISALSDWLEMVDLTKLDSAVCNMKDRKTFLQLISNPFARFTGCYDHMNQREANFYWKWLTIRSVLVNHVLVVDNNFHANIEGCFDKQKICLSAVSLGISVYGLNISKFSNILKLLPESVKFTFTNCMQWRQSFLGSFE
jgi:hypothetical protein